MLVKPPVEIDTTTNSAPSSASRWSVVLVTVSPMSRSDAIRSTQRTMSGSGSGFTSSSTISASCSDGVLATSMSSFGTHW